MKTRIVFWLLAGATVYLFGLPLLRASAPPIERNPFAFPEPSVTPGALFVVFVITVVLLTASGPARRVDPD